MRLLLSLVLAGVSALSAQTPSPEDAEALHRKILVIVRHSTESAGAPRRTTVSEPEVNAYLRYKLHSTLPTGVTEPGVTLVGAGRLAGRAIVDLDQVRRKQSSGGWLDPTSYLTGKLPVTATGVLVSKDGSAHFELETAEVSGVPIPKALLQEIVSFYTRSKEHPRGISFDQPFDLPAGIDHIEIGRGQASVVQ